MPRHRDGTGGGASTDFGNVSQGAASLLSALRRVSACAHSTAMTEAARSPLAHDSAIATAKVLALTACDLLTNPALLEAARADFMARGK